MNRYKERSDEDLVQLLRQGDHGAFTEIYRRYKGMLYLHLYRKLIDKAEAEDILHDLFATLWAKRMTLSLSDNLSGYLYRAVQNRALDRVSHQEVATRYENSLQQYITSGPLLADHLARERELRRIIEAEVANLPGKMRAVFKLSRFQHRSHREIAAHLALSEKTVKNQINNALRILRAKLGPLTALLLTLYQYLK